jgi:RNA recognition motif-containing protein
MTIYIQNLSREVGEDQLRKIFGAHGTVEKINILKDKVTGLPVGIAFVQMPERAEAEAAIKALNRKEFGGMALNLKEGMSPEEGAAAHERGGKWGRKSGPGQKGTGPNGGAGYRGEGGPHAGAVRRGGQRGT